MCVNRFILHSTHLISKWRSKADIHFKKMFITAGLLVIITTLILVWIRNRRYEQSLFKRLGIPGPAPDLLFGNLTGFREKGVRQSTRDWTKQYGKVFGYYEGAKPILMVSDPEIVKHVAIKDFNKFHSRKEDSFRPPNDPKESMFSATGEKWKKLRSVASPSFTTGRMKQMSPLINKCVTDLIKLFDEKCTQDRAFDIYSEFGRLTTDVISSVAFGIDAGCLSDPKSPFLVEARKIFDAIENFPLKLKIFLQISSVFPGFAQFLRKYNMIASPVANKWHFDMAKEIIETRQASEDSSRMDFVNLMLETNKQIKSGTVKELSEDHLEDDYDENAFLKVDTNHIKKQQPMTVEEMQGQIVVFLNAGYETTSTALGFTAYRLALNPEVQTKLQDEIDEHFPGDVGQIQLLKLYSKV